MAATPAPDVVAKMLASARAVQAQAHAPYSRFHVGAAVLDEAGRVHVGCNVENASYPQGSCAESNAFGAMVAAGGKQVRALLVVGEGENLVTPCGGCRQRLRELAAADTPVLIAGPDGVRATFTLEQLLPNSFGPENLR